MKPIFDELDLLTQTIEKFEFDARLYKDAKIYTEANYYKQLSKWLKELKEIKEKELKEDDK